LIEEQRTKSTIPHILLIRFTLILVIMSGKREAAMTDFAVARRHLFKAAGIAAAGVLAKTVSARAMTWGDNYHHESLADVLAGSLPRRSNLMSILSSIRKTLLPCAMSIIA
jgi:hypothetical protein